MRSFTFFFLTTLQTFVFASANYKWQIGGDFSLNFTSNQHFEITEQDLYALSAHLPGFTAHNVASNPINIQHTFTKDTTFDLKQEKNKVHIFSPWEKSLPPDFVHLLYAVARKTWLNQDIYPVHAACIGNEDKGYYLVLGPSGAGKTSTILNLAYKKGYKVFSGDKTLLKIQQGKLFAIAGTTSLTIRLNDIDKWKHHPKNQPYYFDDRLVFKLPNKYMTQKKCVPIRGLFIIGLNDHIKSCKSIAPMQALHILYPLFLDKQRADALIDKQVVLFDGEIPFAKKQYLAKNLAHVLHHIPTYKITGSLQQISHFIQHYTTSKKVLFGICGIGGGHLHRQIPIIDTYIQRGYQIAIFTYGPAIEILKKKYPQIPIIPVYNPFLKGNNAGLDFEGSIALAEQDSSQGIITNLKALDAASKVLGKPDLVISDYEQISAQYAYAQQVLFITLDQQSKFLTQVFPKTIDQFTYIDEIRRLNMFFPKAKKRIAISFFSAQHDHPEVKILPPTLRNNIVKSKGKPLSSTPSILVYITKNQMNPHMIRQWLKVLSNSFPHEYQAHIFLPNQYELPSSSKHLQFYHHGDPAFDSCLIHAHGIISTAGHTLLSEAMYLEKPVYAVPLPIYEQQLNGHIINQNHFGLARSNLNEKDLLEFLQNLSHYKNSIQKDTKILFKSTGNNYVINEIDRLFYE